MRRVPPHRPRATRLGDAGFTLAEVMIAMFILLVGVLGTVALVDGANRASALTRAREGGTNLSRDIVESVRTIKFVNLSQANATTTLQAQPGLADIDTSLAGWQVERRGVKYTLAATVCTIDDAEDGIGAASTTAAGFCSTSTATTPPDQNPFDLKRVTITATWKEDGRNHTTKQATMISTTDRGPVVTDLETNPAGGRTFTTGSSIAFVAQSPTAASVEWSLDGVFQNAVTKSGSSWPFTWNLGTAVGSPTGDGVCSTTNTGVLDGSYFVSAKGYDASGVTSGPRVLTISLNRCPPLPVTVVQGGRNPLWETLDVQWDANKEEDVVGYYVERRLGASDNWKKVDAGNPFNTTCNGLITDRTYCSEPDIDTLKGKNVDYRVIAVDRDPSGALRESTITGSFVTASTSNTRPTTPVISSGGTTSTLSWNPSTDPNGGDYVDFYRIYRDGAAGPDDRYDVVDNTPDANGKIVYTDPEASGTHTYVVTAVDSKMAESMLSNPVIR